jgi:hypothetical protein
MRSWLVEVVARLIAREAWLDHRVRWLRPGRRLPCRARAQDQPPSKLWNAVGLSVQNSYINFVAKLGKTVRQFIEERFASPPQREHILEENLLGLESLDGAEEIEHELVTGIVDATGASCTEPLAWRAAGYKPESFVAEPLPNAPHNIVDVVVG